MTTFIRITIIIWTLAFFGGLTTGKSVFATPEGSGILGTEEYDNKKRLGDFPVWYQKPIQCMSTKAVLQNTKKTGMEVFWGGRGKSNTTEQPVALNVFVFLAMNIKTKEPNPNENGEVEAPIVLIDKTGKKSKEIYEYIGFKLVIVPGKKGLPDLVFMANQLITTKENIIFSKMNNEERAPEVEYLKEYFGFDNFYQCSLELWGSKGKIYTDKLDKSRKQNLYDIVPELKR
mgnify:CR=1 FL=1